VAAAVVVTGSGSEHLGLPQGRGRGAPVTCDGSPGKLRGAAGDEADGRAFAERCKDDRHHFRFIDSPDEAVELSSLRGFNRELMDQASRDLGTRLDWVAVDHWNTEHPHIHILVRGRAGDGSDLVISRDYISKGLRARAGDLVTRELGPRSELEVRRGLEAEVAAERWTRLDSALTRVSGRAEGVIDLRPEGDARHDPLREGCGRSSGWGSLSRLALPAGFWPPIRSRACVRWGSAGISSSGCTRASQRMAHPARPHPGRSTANAMVNR